MANLLTFSIIVKYQAVPCNRLLDDNVVYTLSYSVVFGERFTAPFNNTRTLNSKLNRQMRFSLPSIKCSVAPSSFRLLPSARWSNQIVEHSSDNIVGRWEEPPNSSLTIAKNAFVGWALNFKVRVLLKDALSIFYLPARAESFLFSSKNKGMHWSPDWSVTTPTPTK